MRVRPSICLLAVLAAGAVAPLAFAQGTSVATDAGAPTASVTASATTAPPPAVTVAAPALWTTTRTLKDRGPYKNANMTAWNAALTAACARHPNMRVYDWASEVRDDWFTTDGIHFNQVGYRERSARIARALARAFPKSGPRLSGCFVHAD